MTAPTPRRTLLLVDGYNVIGQGQHLRTLRDREGLDAARRGLIQELVNYSAHRDIETQVIFDAHYRDDGGSREVMSDRLAVVYTDFGQSADTYIEKTCAVLKRDLAFARHRLMVATSDRTHRLTVSGYGAEWMSCAQLLGDMDRSSQTLRRDRGGPTRSAGRFLASGLDRSVREKLAQMRYG